MTDVRPELDSIDLPPLGRPIGTWRLVPAHRLDATEAVLADRERELLELKGPCSNGNCRLHHAHSGPCDQRQEARDFTDFAAMARNPRYQR